MNLYAHKRFFKALLAMTLWASLCHAQQTGPNCPDYCTTSGASNDVNLLTGDLHFSLPLLNVPGPEGGYSMDLNYLSGITYDQEASWVGLGWSFFPGAINRNVNGYPDDWNGADIEYQLSNLSDYRVINNPAKDNYVSLGFQRILGSSKSMLGYRKQHFSWPGAGSGTNFSASGYGSLYLKNARSSGGALDFGAAQANNSFMDVYHMIPYDYTEENGDPVGSETELWLAYSANVESGNCLTFPNYDTYCVNTSGLDGTMSLKLFECGNLTGENKQLGTAQETVDDVKGNIQYLYNDASDGFTRTQDQKYFFFENEHSGYLENLIDEVTGSGDNYSNYNIDTLVKWKLPKASQEYYNDSIYYNDATFRKGSAKHVEFYTNSELCGTSPPSNFIEANGFTRTLGNNTCPGDGIGAFVITSPTGMNYHFSLPVYQLENETLKSYKEISAETEDNHFKYIKEVRYAYSWLLTAVTGPDYVDLNTNGELDENDKGYWVEFTYAKQTDVAWETDKSSHTKFGINTPLEPTDLGYMSYFYGTKQVYSLTSIRTRTHMAKFYLEDNSYINSQSATVNNKGGAYRLKEIVLLSDYDSSTDIPSDILLANSTQCEDDEDKSLEVIEFFYDTEVNGNSNPFLSKVKVYEKGKKAVNPSHKFEYFSNSILTDNNQDVWGYWKKEPWVFSLKTVEYPMGSKKHFTYESDSYYLQYAFKSFDDFYYDDEAVLDADNYYYQDWPMNENIEHKKEGGVRVSKIRTEESSNSYKDLVIDYSNPYLSEENDDLSSGVISYRPFYDYVKPSLDQSGHTHEDRLLPLYYQEYPRPEVNYEYVTLYDEVPDKEIETKVMHKYFVGAEMGSAYKPIVVETESVGNPITLSNQDEFTWHINKLVDRTSKLGRLEYTQSTNKFGQELNQTYYVYFDEKENKASTVSESFYTRKTFIPDVSETGAKQQWFLCASSRTIVPNILKTIVTVSDGFGSPLNFAKFDLYTGMAIETETGSTKASKPAYRIGLFESMGSKTFNSAYSHQLASKAESYEFDDDKNYMVANIQSFSKDWKYRELSASTDKYIDATTINANKVWRPDRQYVWKGDISKDGSYRNFYEEDLTGTVLHDKRFNWTALGTLDADNESNGWIKATEITRYDQNGIPITIENGNSTTQSFKMGPHDKFMYVKGDNTPYHSFCFTGFEAEKKIDSDSKYTFGSEIITNLNVARRASHSLPPSETEGCSKAGGVNAHTGKFFLESTSVGENVWFYAQGNNVPLKDGAYTISVWMHEDSHDSNELKVYDIESGASTIHTKTKLEAINEGLVVGEWVQVRLTFTVSNDQAGHGAKVCVNHVAGDLYVDDFKFHPSDVPVVGNVYDNITGKKLAELNANNFALKYEYTIDNEDREVTTLYKESLKYGFKKVSTTDKNFARGYDD